MRCSTGVVTVCTTAMVTVGCIASLRGKSVCLFAHPKEFQGDTYGQGWWGGNVEGDRVASCYGYCRRHPHHTTLTLVPKHTTVGQVVVDTCSSPTIACKYPRGANVGL